MADLPDHVVHVEIFGQQYAIRTALEPSYVRDLAAFVDAKMRAASDATPNSDVLRLAVLTALNVTDELFRNADTARRRTAQVSERAAALEQLLDEALR